MIKTLLICVYLIRMADCVAYCTYYSYNSAFKLYVPLARECSGYCCTISSNYPSFSDVCCSTYYSVSYGYVTYIVIGILIPAIIISIISTVIRALQRKNRNRNLIRQMAEQQQMGPVVANNTDTTLDLPTYDQLQKQNTIFHTNQNAQAILLNTNAAETTQFEPIGLALPATHVVTIPAMNNLEDQKY